jgi:transposase InsO family protein
VVCITRNWTKYADERHTPLNVGYGAPQTLISDSGGAYIAHEFAAVCTRLEIDHQTIVSTQGESYMNLMETHFNIQRRLYLLYLI